MDYPCYIEAYENGSLKEKVDRALQSLSDCRACPRLCSVNRLQDSKKGVCRIGRYAVVSSYFAHFGEEAVLVGYNGSGTIFFSSCNLRCVFCQNWDISWNPKSGREVRPEDLARIMIRLQDMGCHNINFVTPEHVVPQIVEALPYAIELGLKIPIVYNTGAYDGMESLELMDGLIDIYMPDFKFWSPEASKKFLKAEDYPQVVKAALKEMYRQVGDFQEDNRGIAKRGIILRHLVMPNHTSESMSILEWIAKQISTGIYLNIMAQYRPEHYAFKYPEIARGITKEEYIKVVQFAEKLGFTKLDSARPRARRIIIL